MDGKKSIDKIKNSIESLLNTKTDLVPKKITKEDKDKILFEKIIKNIELVDIRSFILEEKSDINLSKYDNKFFNIIDDLILLHFGIEASELISFYLYERHNPDGSINQILDNENTPIPLENPSDLWNLIQIIKTFKKPKSK